MTDKPAATMGDLNMDGKPGEGTQSGPEIVTTKIGEKEVSIPKDVATALQAANEAAFAAKKGADEARAQAEQLREQLAALQKGHQDGKPKDAPDYETLLFTDPKAAVERLRQEILAEVSGAVSRQQLQERFWSEFYDKNKDLKEFDGYVKFVFQRELPKYGKLEAYAAMDQLATSVKGELLKMSGGKVGSDKKLVGEGGGEKGTSKKGDQSNEVDTVDQVTTASILKARSEARRVKMQPTGSKTK